MPFWGLGHPDFRAGLTIPEGMVIGCLLKIEHASILLSAWGSSKIVMKHSLILGFDRDSTAFPPGHRPELLRFGLRL